MAEAKPAAAAQGKGEQDPSMEEILQSIRRIIAEDDKKEGPPKDAPADLSADVLELTEMVQEESSAPAKAEAKPAEKPAGDVLAHIDSALAVEPAKPVPPAPVIPEPKPTAAAQDNDRLVSDQTAAMSLAAMKKLEQAKPAEPVLPPITPSMAFRSGATVEDLAMEALKPMLRDWLNANLPAVVERIVDKEVKKLKDS